MQRFASVVLGVKAFAGSSALLGGEAHAMTSPRSARASPESSGAPAADRLLTYSVAGFRAHPPVNDMRFHHVRIARILSPDGTLHDMPCGEVSGERGVRTHFATVKTSGYGQGTSAQAAGLRERKSMNRGMGGDLSPVLQHRFDALAAGGRR